MTRDAIWELYQAESSAYKRFVAEGRGDPVQPGDLKNRSISPKRVREARRAWDEAFLALRKAAGPDEIRELLQAKGAGKWS